MKAKLYFYIFLIFLYCIRFEESPDDPTTLEGALKHSFYYIMKNLSYTPLYTPDKIILYHTGSTYTGDLDFDNDGNARNDIDNLCRSFLPSQYQYMANVKGFISINSTDQISNFPTLYNVPTDLPILGPDPNNPNRLVANNWADLWDFEGSGYIRNTLQVAIGLTWYWWSGSDSSGNSTSNHCANWTSNVGYGQYGQNTYLDGMWITGSPMSCDSFNYLLCIAW